jgi:hypothetical protein
MLHSQPREKRTHGAGWKLLKTAFSGAFLSPEDFDGWRSSDVDQRPFDSAIRTGVGLACWTPWRIKWTTAY